MESAFEIEYSFQGARSERLLDFKVTSFFSCKEHLLPCLMEVFGIVQNIEFEIRLDLGCTIFKTSRKVILDNPSVCVSVCLAVAFVTYSHERKS